jgi:hypothetical protein
MYLSQMIDKEAKTTVDEAVEEAKKSPEPALKDLWTDIYYKGTEPPSMRGREREEVCFLRLSSDLEWLLIVIIVASRFTIIKSCFDCFGRIH